MMARMPVTAILDAHEPRDATVGAANRPGVALVTRRRRVAALALDLAVLAGFAVVASLLSLAWMLARTEAGRYDLAIGDSTFAFALLLAAVPARVALLAADVAVLNATPGQRRMGLTVEGASPRRLLRLAVHPLGVVAWLWLAVVANLATLPVVGLVLLAVAMTGLLGVVASTILVLRAPSSAGAHDILAGTRLVAR
jgi:hypothetical protein